MQHETEPRVVARNVALAQKPYPDCEEDAFDYDDVDAGDYVSIADGLCLRCDSLRKAISSTAEHKMGALLADPGLVLFGLPPKESSDGPRKFWSDASERCSVAAPRVAEYVEITVPALPVTQKRVASDAAEIIERASVVRPLPTADAVRFKAYIHGLVDLAGLQPTLKVMAAQRKPYDERIERMKRDVKAVAERHSMVHMIHSVDDVSYRAARIIHRVVHSPPEVFADFVKFLTTKQGVCIDGLIDALDRLLLW